MKDYSKLTDTQEARRRRQAKRRESLNEVAQDHGYDTWTKMETEIINHRAILEIEMTIVKAERLVEGALEFPGKAHVDNDSTTYVVANNNGTISVCDNGEEVVCGDKDEAVKIVLENLSQ